jgi:hypothetical protein
VSVVEDLELVNGDQPEVVVEVFRQAVAAHVERIYGNDIRGDRVRQRLRERASFHLLVPMLESYFFTDDQALDQIPRQSPHEFDRFCDMEDFETADPDYLKAIASLPPHRVSGIVWQASEWYPRHPKHYLNYLSAPHPSYDAKGGSYKEADHGAAALRALRPEKVFSNARHVRFLRSLASDLGDALEIERPYPFDGQLSEVTFRPGHPENVLRNI